MKNTLFVVILAFVAVGAYQFGNYSSHKKVAKTDEIQTGFAKITSEELQDYLKLKDERLKYKKADEILSKIMLLFLSDLGLRAENPNTSILAPFQQKKRVLKDDANKSKNQAVKQDSTEKQVNQGAEPSDQTKAQDTKKDESNSTNATSLAIATEDATGAVKALYQAILWRGPDTIGGPKAISKFSIQGWDEFMANAKAMVLSAEFLNKVEPNHSPQEIINHMYAVFIGRCAQKKEMDTHLKELAGSGPPKIVSSILTNARSANVNQIFAGGFDPSSCP